MCPYVRFSRAIAAAARRPRRAGARRDRRDRRGAALVEFAVVAPVLFLIILGMIEVGRGVMVSQLLVNASREGARKAALTDMTTGEVTSFVEQYLTSVGVPVSGATITIKNQSSAGGGFGTTSDLSTVPAGMGIEVSVEVTTASVSWLPTSNYMPDSLQGSTVMRKETSS